MPRNGHIIVCFILAAAIVGIAGLLQTAEPDHGNGIIGSSRVEEASQVPMRGESSIAFLVLDIRLNAEGGVTLTWSDLGPNFVYTVESVDWMLGRWFMVEPLEQWPTTATSWTDTSVPTSGTRFYRIQTEALYDPPAAPTDVTATARDGEIVISWEPVPGAFSYNVYWCAGAKFSPLDAERMEGVTSPFIHSGLSYGVSYNYVVTAIGNKGESEVSDVVTIVLAPPLDGTVATTMSAASEFLYTGDSPIQTGVAEGTMEPKRVAVLRGKVTTRDGQPLSDVTITVLDHPEYGQTLTRGDGMFDIAVNGGGYLTVNYQKDGYLRAQRQVNVPWQDYVWLPDVALIPADAQVTVIDFSEPMQVAQGSPVTDGDGTRQATLLFPEETQAELVMPDGSTQPLGSLSVRATEYTVGDNGPKAMPAELPPTSGYTYCVEFTADEALAAGAKDVVFGEPISFYLENFIGFPVGIQVPTAAYDRVEGTWVPVDDGRVVEILNVSGGLAELDTTGDGEADNGAALGVTDAERERLAVLYAPGETLWRVLIPHLTPYDCNFGPVPPAGANQPNPPPTGGNRPDDDSSTDCGSIIESQNQTLGERIAVTGTPFTLNYRSDRVPGRGGSLEIPLSGESIPPPLKRIELEIQVAGRKFKERFPAEPNQTYTFVWDRRDAYGRVLQGTHLATIRIGYVYEMVYALPPELSRSFGFPSGVRVPGDIPARQDVTMWQMQRASVGTWDARGQGLGGWSLSVHHAYDPVGEVLYLGDGRRRTAAQLERIITTVAGGGDLSWPDIGDGGPADEAVLVSPCDMVMAPDGSMYIADQQNERVRRVDPDGIITTVAGTGNDGYNGDGGQATEAELNSPTGVAIGPDGSLYIADHQNNRIRQVTPDGIITTVAGNGDRGYGGDGGRATAAQLYYPMGIAVGPDGSLYIADSFNHRVRRVAPDGIIATAVGDGTAGSGGDGGPATSAQLAEPRDVALDSDGNLYVCDWSTNVIRRVTTDGIISTMAGNRLMSSGFSGDGGPATEARMNNPTGVATSADGVVYIADSGNHRIRAVGPDGIITTVAGGRYDLVWPDIGDGGPATAANLREPYGVSVAPDGNVYVSHRFYHCIRRIGPPLPQPISGAIVVPAEDGSELYSFDITGRHLRTLHALTGEVLYAFSYNGDGLLSDVTDGDGNITMIERDGQGNPTAIVSPFGQRTELTLDTNGYLSSVTNEAGETHCMTSHGDGGLLASYSYPRGDVSRFSYDAAGRLIHAEGREGGSSTLARAESEESYEVTLKTALGRVTRYLIERSSIGDRQRVTTFPDGTEREEVMGADGSRTDTSPDGTVITSEAGPDPRWGMEAPLLESVTIATPGGLTYTRTRTLSATLADPENLLSLQSYTDTETVNSRTYTTTYDAGTRRLTRSTPEGRQIVWTLDGQGRLTEAQLPGLHPLRFTYDARGLLTELAWDTGVDSRVTTLDYDSQGYLRTITDPLLRTIEFERDPAGRATKRTLTGGLETLAAYDASGNILSLTPPGRPTHTFTYTPLNGLSSYTAPSVGPGSSKTSYSYDLDGELARVTDLDGRIVEREYDGCNCGRLSRLAYPGGEVTFDYDATTGQMTRVTAVDGSVVEYDYDGFLLTGTTWSGTVSGSVERTYNDEFQLASLSVSGVQPITYQYDQDGFVVGAGDLSIVRDPQSAGITGTTLGKVSDERVINGFSEVESYRASYDSTELYAADYVRDKKGRVTEKTETIEGATNAYEYTYDPVGQLTDVVKNGVEVAEYTHDRNGNRLCGPKSTYTGTYDDQDRLLQFTIGAKYTYTGTGQLLTKTLGGQTTTYQYDALGNLVSVALPDETTIEYVVDGRSRRIGKKVNGTLVQGFLYQNRLKVVAQLDGANAVVTRFVYATQSIVPDFMIKDSRTYRILSDHVGSPRLVVDISSGAIVQRIDYDEFGNVIQDTNPGFQPFGFAGGLYDTHTELTRFGARDYDPQAGRWTAKDPSGFATGDTNLYRYVRNDPVNWGDHSGNRREMVYWNSSEWYVDGKPVGEKGPQGGNKPKEVEGDERFEPQEQLEWNKWKPLEPDRDGNTPSPPPLVPPPAVDPFDPGRGAYPGRRPDVYIPREEPPGTGGGLGGAPDCP
jgi:RHS repeat-associated protein